MFNFINITFAIVRELSILKRFNLSANVSEIKMESEPKPSNAFEQNFLSPFEKFIGNICKHVELFFLYCHYM